PGPEAGAAGGPVAASAIPEAGAARGAARVPERVGPAGGTRPGERPVASRGWSMREETVAPGVVAPEPATPLRVIGAPGVGAEAAGVPVAGAEAAGAPVVGSETVMPDVAVALDRGSEFSGEDWPQIARPHNFK